MKGKFKAAGVSLLTMASSWLTGHAQDNTSHDDTGNENRIEHKIDSVKNDSVQIVDLAKNTNSADTLSHAQALREKILTDSLAFTTDSIPIDSIANNISESMDSIPVDSVANNVPEGFDPKTFDQNMFDAFCLIAHFENIKMKAYRLSMEKHYTIGIGFTRDENGRPVKAGSRIKDADQLMRKFTQEISDIDTYIDKYLVVDSMLPQEKAAIRSIAFNCGPGVIEKMAPAINEYCTSRDDPDRHQEAYNIVRNEFMKRRTAKGKILEPLEKRRYCEFKVFTYEVVMKNNAPSMDHLQSNEIDLYNSPIGAIYSACKIKDIRANTENNRFCDTLKTINYGKNIPDTINSVGKKNRETPQKNVNRAERKAQARSKIMARRAARGR